MVLIYLLIAFFISLLTYQLILAFYPTIEGMETNDEDEEKQNGSKLQYEDYPTDPLVCCKQNSGNIEFLKERVDTLSTTSSDVDKMQTTIDALQQQVNDLGTQMTQLAGNMISQAPVDTSVLEGSDQATVDQATSDETTPDETDDLNMS